MILMHLCCGILKESHKWLKAGNDDKAKSQRVERWDELESVLYQWSGQVSGL